MIDQVTGHENQGKPKGENKPLSLPFDPATLTQGIRVRPAEFARMCDVSRQTVSRWVKNGVVLLFPDGTLDPAASAKRVIGHTDPGRLRARVFKDMTLSIDDWRQRSLLADQKLEAANSRIEYLESFLAESELSEEKFIALLSENIDAIHAKSPGDRLAAIVEFRDAASISAGVELGTISNDDSDFDVLDEAMAKYCAAFEGEGGRVVG